MYNIKGAKKKTNPKHEANILSLITFFFTFEFLRKGYRKDITEDDVYEVLPQFKASKVGDKLEKEWMKEAVKKNPSIYRLLWNCYGRYYFLLGLPQLSSKIIIILVIPQTQRKLISYFKKDTELTKGDAIYYTLLLIGLNIIICTYNHNYQFWITELGIKIKIAFCSLIYRKSINLTSSSLSKSGTGKIITLITKDVNSLEKIIIFLNDIWISLIVIVLALSVLCGTIGISALIGVSLLVLMIPVQVYLGKVTSDLRLKAAKATDRRLKIIQETLSFIKMIKMYTWEKFFIDKISKAREEEMRKIRHFYFARATFTEIGTFIITLTLYIVITSYTELGNHLTAEVVIFVHAVLGALRSPVTISIPLGILRSAELVASVKRIQEVLTENEHGQIVRDQNSEPLIRIEKGTIEFGGHLIIDDINFDIKSGLNLISGSLGSGKSSLLKAVLGDYLLCRGQVKVRGSISYSSEDPWLFPASIKQNILFVETYNEQRYHKVLNVCALNFDINTFKKGDDTIIDDRGRNLSKGQQMRITLARALYRDSDIYLLDECLSSLDMHLQNVVFVECIKKFLKDKIVIMVTHNKQLFRQADNILLLEGGTVKSLQPSELSEQEIDNILVSDPFKHDGVFGDREIETREFVSEESKLVDEARQNIYDENPKKGKVDFHCYKNYCRFGGGALALICIFVLYLATQAGLSYSDKLVYQWVNIEQRISEYNTTTYQHLLEGDTRTSNFNAAVTTTINSREESISEYASNFITTIKYRKPLEHDLFNVNTSVILPVNTTEQNITEYPFNSTNTTKYQKMLEDDSQILHFYTAAIVASIFFIILRIYSYFSFAAKASLHLHKSMVYSVVNATMKFFDMRYFGNILNRFAKDVYNIDEVLPFNIDEFLKVFFKLGGIVVVIVSVNVVFIIPFIIFFFILFFIRKFYIPTGRSLQRLDSATRSPVIGHLNATLDGLSTIRACGAQEILKTEFDRHQDLYTSTIYMEQSASRAFAYSLDILCQCFIAAVIIRFLIAEKDTPAGNVGLAITQALGLTGILQWGVRQWAELENQMTSVERILEYSNIEKENKSGQLLESLISSGKISYKDVNLSYANSKGYVLKNINFVANSGEKVGIVGRTGVGKSSLISILFRLYEYEGTITINDIDIKTLALDFLRSCVVVIPQDPVLFTGTIRSNIDPRGLHRDQEIWNALNRTNLKELVPSLEHQIVDNCSNFSAGQKQLICLARALISKNKIIILDEANANLDSETATLIPKIVEENFQDCTVLIIAHNLQTILNCDKVMVMDQGEIVEFDKPSVLMEDPNGFFYKMVESANLLKKKS